MNQIQEYPIPLRDREGRLYGNERIIAREDTLMVYLRTIVSEKRSSLALIDETIACI